MKAYLDEDDVTALIEAATSLRDKLVIQLLARLGCRVTELVTIQVSDIDFEGRWVSILHLKQRLHLKCPHCTARLTRADRFCRGCGLVIDKPLLEKMQEERRRRVRIDSATLAMIQEWLAKRDRQEERLIPLTRQMVDYIIRASAKRAGLGGQILSIDELTRDHAVSAHRLRDALAVRWLKANQSLDSQKALQQHLGHSKFDTTMKYKKMSGEETAGVYDGIFEGGR